MRYGQPWPSLLHTKLRCYVTFFFFCLSDSHDSHGLFKPPRVLTNRLWSREGHPSHFWWYIAHIYISRSVFLYGQRSSSSNQPVVNPPFFFVYSLSLPTPSMEISVLGLLLQLLKKDRFDSRRHRLETSIWMGCLLFSRMSSIYWYSSAHKCWLIALQYYRFLLIVPITWFCVDDRKQSHVFSSFPCSSLNNGLK